MSNSGGGCRGPSWTTCIPCEFSTSNSPMHGTIRGRSAIGLGQMSAPPRAAPNQPAPLPSRTPQAAARHADQLDHENPAGASRPAAGGSCLAYGDGGPDADGMQKIMSFDLATAAGSRAVIVVEGMSDRVALETLAERRGIALRAQSISIVHL